MTARHHHYLPQGYLKGFTNGQSKTSKLTVIDFEKKKLFETTPRNVGGVRDFNRVDIKGLDQNAIESAMAIFEGRAAASLSRVDKGALFKGEDRLLILNLMALLAVRSPARREHWRKFQAEIVEHMMDLTLATKERWEGVVRDMNEKGESISEEMTFEQMKDFVDRKEYTIEVSTEHHIETEMVGIDAILPHLVSRDWILFRSNECIGPFITSDQPVSIVWNDPQQIPHLYRDHAGFGMRNTNVYFPVSKHCALYGEFDGTEGEIEVTRDLLATLNSKAMTFTDKQVYAPKLSFVYRDREDQISEGKSLLRFAGI